ncbi:MAG TPA: sensor domain-containing diguanylate cyclase [Nitrospirota bacterium]|nr:sensor domain-containing diguanylate cyclase [Nitrospirota bacterium]
MSDEQLKERITQLEQELKQSLSLEKALEDLLEKKLNEIYAHYHISRTIGSLLDMQEMLRQVTGIIRKSLPFDRLSVYLADEKREKLELTFSSGLDIQQKVILQMGEGTPGRIAESGEHVHIHDLSIFYETSSDFIHCPDEKKYDGSYIGIALKVHNETIGVIGLDNSVKYGLGVDDMDFMAILSHQIAAGIEKSRLFDKTEHLSQHDGLTGLYNHRMFEEKLRLEISRRDRTKKSLSLIMLDIDHFKKFNDTYGHQAGDLVLKELAAVMQKQCRCTSIDACCRYGGEEFAIIMPELELHDAVSVAERLRMVVEKTSFSIKDKKPGDTVTVSLGVAGISPSEDISFEEFIKKADEALYLSKRTGRNRVSYSPSASH